MIPDRRNLVWIGKQVLEVPAPAGRVVALPEPAYGRPVENAFDPSAHAGRGSVLAPQMGLSTLTTRAVSTSATGSAPMMGEA
jgi:hypothetical protein